MSHHTKLYRLVKAFDLQHRSQAYSIGCQLAYQGSETVITVSQHHYKVWVDVRSHRTLGKLNALGKAPTGGSNEGDGVPCPAC
jgi:hypothetical protein